MRKTKSYTYFTGKEKGGVCWMIGKKPHNCQNGHDALFNIHRVFTSETHYFSLAQPCWH